MKFCDPVAIFKFSVESFDLLKAPGDVLVSYDERDPAFSLDGTVPSAHDRTPVVHNDEAFAFTCFQ